MAGNYPDVPSRRMAHDGDGSLALELNVSTGVLTAEHTGLAAHIEMNDEDDSSPFTLVQGRAVVIVFPELREIDGTFGRIDAGTSSQIETSPDTTNGFDGTWTIRDASPINAGAVSPAYRTDITSHALSSQRAARYTRLSGNNQFRAFHIYGEISSGETPDRLLIIDENTGLEFVLSQDYGNVPRGSSEDIEIRMRNNSASLTANTIQYTAESLFLSSGNWYTYTLPGGSTYAATQNVASLASATTSGIISVRRVTPGSEVMSLHAGRTYFNVDNWT